MDTDKIGENKYLASLEELLNALACDDAKRIQQAAENFISLANKEPIRDVERSIANSSLVGLKRLRTLMQSGGAK